MSDADAPDKGPFPRDSEPELEHNGPSTADADATLVSTIAPGYSDQIIRRPPSPDTTWRAALLYRANATKPLSLWATLSRTGCAARKRQELGKTRISNRCMAIRALKHSSRKARLRSPLCH
jgi:hypothetical protein